MNVEDTQFLALLVHRGQVALGEARRLDAALRAGSKLDLLLVEELGWTPERVERMRRTRAGEIPEIPGYEVRGSLGHGGTSDVFRAREKKTGNVLALKVLNAASTHDATIRSSFVREARLLEQLAHPGLVKGFGVAKSGSTYFSKLECIEGSTLLELLDGGQVFSEEVALRVVLAAAEVLAYLSDEKVVHRDVKPGNIMLDHNGRVKLIDLGFALRKGERSLAGTGEYVSPELAGGDAEADLRGDIYSLGVTLFHVAVGRLPFEGETNEETVRMHVTQALSSPELKSRRFSPHLHYFVSKMMAKEATLRYQSWQELIADIRSLLEGKRVVEDLGGSAQPTPPAKAPPVRRKF